MENQNLLGGRDRTLWSKYFQMVL